MDSKQWANEKLSQFDEKFSMELGRLGNQIPHYAKNDKYIQDMAKEDITWWTNGFLGGITWLLYDYTKKPVYRERAEKLEIQLDEAFQVFNGLHHDVGFMWLHTAVADYRRFQGENAKRRALHAAALLAGRYNAEGEFLRSWNGDNKGWVIIDSLMNIPLLYWASEETGDSRFKFMAEKHAEKVLNNHLRKDGSVNHICIFDEVGNLQETPAGQGYAAGSSWSRGQSWAIYGFALSYFYTKDRKYLNAAKQVAHYFIANIEATGFIPVVDFRAPDEPVLFDTSAGLCAVCGMLEISKHVGEQERKLYQSAAIKILRAIEKKAANWEVEADGIIGLGTCAYHTEDTRHVSLIYSDYFFLEALMRLAEKYKIMW